MTLPKMSILTDHAGKSSNIRMVSTGSFLIAALMVLSPMFGRHEYDIELIALFLLGGPGLKVWQSVGGGDAQ